MKIKLLLGLLILILFVIGCNIEETQTKETSETTPIKESIPTGKITQPVETEIQQEAVQEEQPEITPTQKESIISPEVQTQNEDTDTKSTSDDTLDQLKKSLEDLNKQLKKSSSIMSKISECGNLCAGESKDIPYVLAECQSTCNQVYYYTGEKGLDELIEDYKK